MDRSLPPLLQATSGALGSVVGKTVVFPLDLAVTRIQHAPSSANKRKLSLISTLYRLTQRKGLHHLYSGFSADAISTLLSSFIYFYLYSYLHKIALRRHHHTPTFKSSPAGIGSSTASNSGGSTGKNINAAGVKLRLSAGQELMMGLVAGMISKGVVLPISAVCVRQQLASEHEGDGPPSGSVKGKERERAERGDTGLWGTLRAIHKEEGILGLWSALPPSIPLALLPSLTLYIHTLLLRILLPARHRAHPPGSLTFLIGAASNALATIPLYPMVLIKVLSQSGTTKGSQLDTLLRIVREKGVKGLYQGIEGQLVKGFVQQGVMMLLKQRIEEGIVKAYRATR